MQAMVTQLASPWQKFQQYLQGVEDNLARVINEGFDRALALCMSISFLSCYVEDRSGADQYFSYSDY